MILNILLIIIGLGILIGGAELMVRGASSLALKLKISALIIGLTVVSFGTSAPELIVNIISAVSGSPDLAVGNVLGSNIANIMLVLGVSSVIIALKVKSSTVWREIPFAILGAVLLLLLANDVFFAGATENVISRADGLILLALMAVFMYYVFGAAKKDKNNTVDEISKKDDLKTLSISKSIALVIIGIGGLVIGGNVLVDNAVDIAKSAGLSEALIGITIIGIGTSLPELSTSVVAAFKRQTDLAIGNVIGSNIFNVFWIIGLTATIQPIPYNIDLNIDALLGVLATVLLFGFMFFGKVKHQLERWEGITFLILYFTYIIFLILRG